MLDRITSMFPTWLGVIWITCCFLIVHCCSALFYQSIVQFGPAARFFTWFPIVYFQYFILIVRRLISLVLTLPHWTETKKKHLIITWLSSALFFFKDGADHPWPLNCLSASLRWRPWKWSIVLIKVLKVLNAVYRPDLWWHWRGCGQNFNTVKWKHSKTPVDFHAAQCTTVGLFFFSKRILGSGCMLDKLIKKIITLADIWLPSFMVLINGECGVVLGLNALIEWICSSVQLTNLCCRSKRGCSSTDHLADCWTLPGHQMFG